ncbi:MAG: hypothetical protein ABIP55_01650, partial [Tepidisphaeraceae bacterium]
TAVIEPLEQRRLLAGDFNAGAALPYQLDFNRSRTGVLDRDGSGTGFTWVQPNADGTELDTRKMDLKIGVGILRLYSTGNNFEATNTLRNALTVRYAASSRPWVISARINGTIPQIDANGEQGGILFGPDQDNYVKLVLTKTAAGQGLQFLDEQKFKTGYRHQLPQTITNIGSFGSLQTIDLYMSGDADTGVVRALYRVNGGAVTQMPDVLTLTGDKKGAFFSNAGFAGVMAAHTQAGTGIDFTIDQFGIKRGVLLPEASAGEISFPSGKVFNDVRGGGGQTIDTSIRNTGNGPVTVNGMSVTGADGSMFTAARASGSFPVTLAPNETLPIKLTFSAPSGTALGVKAATLTISSSANTETATLRGLATNGIGGENEPSLQRVLDLYNFPINVGDANPSDVYIGDPPSVPNDEVFVQQLRKAGSGPVTIAPLAVFGVSSNPALRLGYYEPGSPAARTELFSVDNVYAQSVNVVADGSTSFDPGSGAFAIYSTWPGFTNGDGSLRTIYSEDVFNTFDSNEKRHIRFYPLKDSGGNVVANSYIMAHEEFSGGYDAQDFVAIISNVQPNAAGAEIGSDNLDGPPAPDRLVFNRFRNPDPLHPETAFHDQAKVRIRNSGSATLVISSIGISGPFQIVSGGGAQNIQEGKFIDVLVKFVGDSTSGVKTGALTINSSDADEPAKVVALAGFNQTIPEANTESTLAQMINQVFGYQIALTHSGQALNNGGKVEAVGDEVLSPYWFRADGNLPVTVKQLSSFHTQGDAAALRRHNNGSNTTTDLFTAAGVDAQSYFPRKQGQLSSFAEASFTLSTGQAFGFRIDNEWSDPKKNVQEQPGGGYGHHVRFFPLKDTRGQVVPNTYLMVMDYQGINYDYNDNTYLISNVRPETPGGAAPASFSTQAIAGMPAAGKSLAITGVNAGGVVDGDDDSSLML